MIQTPKKDEYPQISMDFSIHEWANRYFFVSNMSEFDVHVRPRYNVFWKELLGDLTPEQESALRAFGPIRKKYGYKGVIEDAFFLHDTPWDILQTQLPPEEIAIFQETFDVMEPMFQKLYEMDLPLLEEKKRLFEEHFSSFEYIPNILSDLEILFEAPINGRNIRVFLLVASPRGGGGSAVIGRDYAYMEVSRLTLEQTPIAYSTTWHEIIHASFEREGSFFQNAQTTARERKFEKSFF